MTDPLTPSEGALLHRVADLLYDAGDPRATPWPEPQELGRLRSRLRGLADSAQENEETS